MSKVFNMVGGGGGKNISSIIITGLSSTDIVTCTKDGKSYPATWDETAQHWEIVGLPLGTFTITATNRTKTTTETVLIDIAGVYEIEMDYKLWLYKYGDQCDDITGGWYKNTNAYVGSYYSSDGTVSFENEYIFLQSPNGKAAVTTTTNTISLDGYSKLKVQYGAMNDSIQGVFISNSISSNLEANNVGAIYGVSSNTELELDISGLTGSYYFSCGNGNGRSCQYKAIWLEV